MIVEERKKKRGKKIEGSISSLFLSEAQNLHDVGAVGSHAALALVVVGVGVAAGPLKVDVIALVHAEPVRHVVVLRRREGLHDVTTLSADIKIVDLTLNVR